MPSKIDLNDDAINELFCEIATEIVKHLSVGSKVQLTKLAECDYWDELRQCDSIDELLDEGAFNGIWTIICRKVKEYNSEVNSDVQHNRK